MDKIKYEKPMSLNAGEVASVLGAMCSTGGGATDGCLEGDDPAVGPICSPAGSTATHNCGDGGTNLSGNCTNGTSAFGCDVGNAPSP